MGSVTSGCPGEGVPATEETGTGGKDVDRIGAGGNDCDIVTGILEELSS